LNGMHVAGQSCNGYSYMYGARFEEQHIGWCNGRLQKMYSASDIFKPLLILEITRNTQNLEAW
jgi:hypothetical protein